MNRTSTPLSTPAPPRHGVGERAAFYRTLLGYGLVSALLLAPSARLWWQQPLRLTEHEFDFFLGQLGPGYDGLDVPGRFFLFGKLPHLILFGIVGGLFFRLATRYRATIEAMSARELGAILAGLGLLYLGGLPTVSPDVFYYLGYGWLESHYHFNVNLHPLAELPGYQSDEMFRNIHPPFVHLTGNYGPLFQSYCSLLSGWSGGNPKLALALFKLGNLGFYLAGAAVLGRLARSLALPARHAVFVWAGNPLFLFGLLTCAHNDVLQNFFLLLCLLCVRQRRPLLSGACLAVAVGLKLVGVVFLPALLLFWLRRGETPGFRPRAALAGLVGFGAVLGGSCVFNEGAWGHLVFMASAREQALRGSLVLMLEPVVSAAGVGSVPGLRTLLAVGYVALGAWVTLRPWVRGEPVGLAGLAGQMFWLFTLYFLVGAPGVMEWYLTWAIAPALLSGRRGPWAFAIFLVCFYLPLVILTIRSGARTEYAANSLLYLLLAASAGWLLLRPGAGSAEAWTPERPGALA